MNRHTTILAYDPQWLLLWVTHTSFTAALTRAGWTSRHYAQHEVTHWYPPEGLKLPRNAPKSLVIPDEFNSDATWSSYAATAVRSYTRFCGEQRAIQRIIWDVLPEPTAQRLAALTPQIAVATQNAPPPDPELAEFQERVVTAYHRTPYVTFEQALAAALRQVLTAHTAAQETPVDEYLVVVDRFVPAAETSDPILRQSREAREAWVATFLRRPGEV